MNMTCRTFAIVLLLSLTGMAGTARAQSAPAAQATAEKGLVFLELYSAERCPFCPQAERNMNDILSDPEVLGFTCMVDYFDAGLKGGLSQPFCTVQQDLYIRMLKSGSRYTPQLVINGRVQLPGYNFQKTAEAIRKERAASYRVQRLMIQGGTKEGSYDIVLPPLAGSTKDGGKTAEQKDPYVLRLILIRKDPRLAIGGGIRQAQEKTPSHVAVAIVDSGFWDGIRTVWTVTLPHEQHGADAFLVVAQDRRTGAIVAAGQSDLAPGPEHKTD